MTLKGLREKKGLTQKYVADTLGVHPSIVGLWELGRRTVPDARVRQLAELYTVSESAIASAVFNNVNGNSRRGRPPKRRVMRMLSDGEKQEREWQRQENEIAKRARDFLATVGRPRYAPAMGGWF